MFIKDSVLDDLSGVAESSREWIHGADMSYKQVVGIRRLSTYFGIEIQSSGLNAILSSKIWMLNKAINNSNDN